MSDTLTLLMAYRDLLLSTQELQTLARQEEWDALLEALPRQQAAQQAIEAAAPNLQQMPAEQREVLVDLLQQVEAANKETMTRIAAWRAEVATILDEIDSTRANAQRQHRAYGA